MYFRVPKTTQEKRYDALFRTQLAEIERDYGPFRSRLRNGKSGYGLPTTYDDITFKTQRTWKKTRRTQYRQKETLLEESEVFVLRKVRRCCRLAGQSFRQTYAEAEPFQSLFLYGEYFTLCSTT